MAFNDLLGLKMPLRLPKLPELYIPYPKVIEWNEPYKPDPSIAAVYMGALKTLCDGGRAYGGELVSNDPQDDAFRSEALIIGPATCEDDTVRIPLAVGEDQSRTWVLSRGAFGMQLKHDHRHRDGSSDVITNYGGDSYDLGSTVYQIFPVDQETYNLFVREGLEASVENNWGVEIRPGEQFVYQMWRPNRNFRLEFDLTQPVTPPPPAWGTKPEVDAPQDAA